MPVKVKERLSKEVKMLLQSYSDPCISIVLPIDDLSANQKADKLLLLQLIKKTAHILKQSYPAKAPTLIQELERMLKQMTFGRNDHGIGLYVAEGVSLTLTFPFQVSENIMIDKNFRLQEPLLLSQYSFPYHVLYVNEHEARLYDGKLKQLVQMKNHHFPMINEVEEYEYQTASRSTSFAGNAHVKSFEKDKGSIKKIRHEDFLHDADELLDVYIKSSQLLVVCGTKRNVAAFFNISRHKNKITAFLEDNIDHYKEKQFEDLVWKSVEKFVEEKTLSELHDCIEKFGKDLVEKGIRSVSKAVNEGRGNILFIESSFETADHKVNNIIKTMLEKEGRVVFVADDTLQKHDCMLLVTRY
jgi:hypothetical protein